MGTLAQVLRNLPGSQDPRLLVSPEKFDDAGVYRLSDTLAIVQTLDFFPPLVDDPAAFGHIAAANSMSDVYAMGGTPVTCLNILGFPDQELSLDLMQAILQGGADKVAEAGAVIAGGHSVRDAEIKYGLSVTGVVHPNRIVTNAHAQAGDQLLLTKPIGSGTLTTAARKDKIRSADLDQCVQIMSDLNRSACEAMVGVGVRAATDITGFGLIGHAHELAEASGVCVTLDAARVPLMEGVQSLAGAGVVTRAARTNLEHVGRRLQHTGVADWLVQVLADAQTSGGLLISAAPDHIDRLVSSLKERGTWSADLVGEVAPQSDFTVRLR